MFHVLLVGCVKFDAESVLCGKVFSSACFPKLTPIPVGRCSQIQQLPLSWCPSSNSSGGMCRIVATDFERVGRRADVESITVSPLGFLARLQLQAASLTLQSRRPPGGICWLWPFPFDLTCCSAACAKRLLQSFLGSHDCASSRHQGC